MEEASPKCGGPATLMWGQPPRLSKPGRSPARTTTNLAHLAHSELLRREIDDD
jgi:hypothetical protein